MKFLAAVAALAVAAPAWAADNKIYTANICQLHSDSSDMTTSLARSVFGGITNNHTSRSMTVVCPLVRDNTTGTGGLSQVTIWGIDRHPTERMECAIRSTAPFGDGSFESASIFWPVGAEANNDSIPRTIFDPISSETFSHPNQFGSGYQINCRIPPRSGATGSAIGQFLVIEE